MYIAEPTVSDEAITQLNTEIEDLVTKDGGNIVKTDDMGRQQLAYPIKKHTEGYYFLFEIEGSGREIAEIERRMRVNDYIIRYLTVRVDEERKTAAKIEAKRAGRKERLAELSADNSNDEFGEEEE
jgi:small subunit ribosomal protein S6